jgi:poly(glycerol-phosphate) alpha-glucosyltransferase
LGRIHPKKGISQLIDAWAELEATVASQWRLKVAGPDEVGIVEDLKRQARAMGVDRDIEWVGPVYGEAKERMLQDADAFVLPSFSEGLPMAVLEAWAFELPVLMTAACNLPEGFSAGAAVEFTHDKEGAARSLAGFLTLPEERLAEIGRAGGALVDGRFNWARVAYEFADVYRWALHGGEMPRSVWRR